MGNLIQTKIKTNISPKVAVGTLLVVIGAVFGAIAFNGLVPTFFTPSNDATSIAATVAPTGWTYVFGPDKKTDLDYKNLLNAVRNGADVKVFIPTDTIGLGSIEQSFICNKLIVSKNSYVGCRSMIMENGQGGYSQTINELTVQYSDKSSMLLSSTFTFKNNGSGSFTSVNNPKIPNLARLYYRY